MHQSLPDASQRWDLGWGSAFWELSARVIHHHGVLCRTTQSVAENPFSGHRFPGNRTLADDVYVAPGAILVTVIGAAALAAPIQVPSRSSLCGKSPRSDNPKTWRNRSVVQ